METIGYGVIGTGGVSARHLAAIERLDGARLAAVADRDLEKARAVAGRSAARPTAYGTAAEVIADPAVAAVVVCVPTQFHAETVIAAAQAGKHVFCEKAMAPTLKECRDMIAAAARHGVRLTVGHSMRYFAPFSQAKRLIDAGEVGEVVAVDGVFPAKATLAEDVRSDFWRFLDGARGHGHIVNLGCHYIDTARFLGGGQALKQVSAWIGNRFSGDRAPEDQYVVTAVTEGGVPIAIAQYCGPEYLRTKVEGLVVFGTKAALEVYWRPDSVRLSPAKGEPRTVDLDPDLAGADPWDRMHRQFRQCLEDPAVAPPVSGEEALRNVEWAMAAYLAHERRAWMDLPLGPEFYEYGGPRLYANVPKARG